MTSDSIVGRFRPEAVSDETRAINDRVVARLAAAPRSTDLAVNRDGSCPSTWWKFGLAEVVADHAAWVEIWVDTASLVGGVSSAIGSVCI